MSSNPLIKKATLYTLINDNYKFITNKSISDYSAVVLNRLKDELRSDLTEHPYIKLIIVQMSYPVRCLKLRLKYILESSKKF